MDDEKQGSDGSLLNSQETFRIRSAIFEVSRQLGTGFLEAVYQEALALEFQEQDIQFIASPALGITYKGKLLVQSYRPDFVCFDSIIVELKVVRELAPEHRALAHRNLDVSGLVRRLRRITGPLAVAMDQAASAGRGCCATRH